MNGYLPVHEACAKAGITSRMLTRLIAEGKVRAQDTHDKAKSGRPLVRYVSFQDILDAQTGLGLNYIDIHKVGSEFGIAPRCVRYQIRHHRLRWRREGAYLQPCIPDLDMFIKQAASKA
jgi:hypothetical protein